MDPLRDYSCGTFSDEETLKNSVIYHRKSSEEVLKNKEFLFMRLVKQKHGLMLNKNFWGAAPVKSYNFITIEININV